VAGAILTPDTLVRASAAGLKPRESLADNDAHGFFHALVAVGCYDLCSNYPLKIQYRTDNTGRGV
jgi:hypothetical protein